MKLGILVITKKHGPDVVGITRAALRKGHEVTIFTMDEAVTLFSESGYAGLCGLDGVRMSFCDHNAKKFSAPVEGLSDEIVCGSQYDNAEMLHEADRVIVL